MSTGREYPMWPLELAASADMAKSGGASAITARDIFPSGRQALSAALMLSGLGRPQFTAVPDWSSACVHGCVSRVTTPVPHSFWRTGEGRISAFVCYEQWGWTRSEAASGGFAGQPKGARVILDRVDSCFGRAPRVATTGIEVWSLGKTIGTLGGGLLSRVGELIAPNANHAAVADALWTGVAGSDGAAVHRCRDYARSVPPDVMALMNAGPAALERAIEDEYRGRRERIALVAASGAAAGWDTWMQDAVAAGTAPVLVPLARAQGAARHQELAGRLLREKGLHTATYHFNYAASYFMPHYEACLAVPVHARIPMDVLEFAIGCAMDTAGATRP